MHFFVTGSIVISFFAFLFCLYSLVRDDVIFIRKNISTEQLFNLAFLTACIAIFCARFLFVVIHFSSEYLNPLVFFLFPYFPGLSLVAGVLGALGFIIFYCNSYRYPVYRIVDFFSVSMLGATTVGYFIHYIGYLFQKRPVISFELILSLGYIVLFAFFVSLLLPKQRSGEFKEGTLGFLFLFSFSLFSLLKGFEEKSLLLFLGNIENILLLGIFFASLGLVIIREKLFDRFSRFGK